MLNFNSTATKEVTYKITIEGHVWELSESDTQRVIDILNGMSSMVSAPQKPVSNTGFHQVPEKREKKPLPEGKRLWQENFVTVLQLEDGTIRVYMDCPLGGSKGQYVRDRIKEGFKSFGAQWTGSKESGEYHWTFKDKKQAENYINSRKKAAKERA